MTSNGSRSASLGGWVPLAVFGIVTALAAVLGLTSGTTTSERPPSDASSPTETDPVRRAIEEVLRDRAQAVLDGDSDAFARTSTGAEQRAWFRRVSRVPIDELRYELGMHDDSATTADRYVADVDEFTGLSDVSDEAAWTWHRMTFERDAAGAWHVAGDDLDPVEVGLAPWEFPGIDITVSDHVVLATDAGARRKEPALAADLDEAWSDVQARTQGSDSDVVVIAMSTDAALRAEGLNRDEMARIGGVTIPVLGAGTEPVEHRVIIAPSSLGVDDRYVRIMLRHELAHVALADYVDVSPAWLTEGIAEYIARQGEPALLSYSSIASARAGITAMPPNGLFYRGDDGDNSTNYAIAWWSLLYLASKEGPDEPLALLDAFKDAGDATRFEEMSALLEDRYGLTADELAAEAGAMLDDASKNVDLPAGS